MNIGFDAKRLFKNFTGLGNYSRFIVNALSENYTSNSYSLYSPSIKDHIEISPIISRSNVHVYSPSAIYKVLKLTSAWRTWGLSRLESVKKLDVYHGLSQELPWGLPKGIKQVVTVHDLIFMRHPEFYNPIDVALYTSKVKSACLQADNVIAVSEQTAHDLVELLGINTKKIVVIPQGCHPNFKRKSTPEQIASVRLKYKLPETYMLSVGTLEKRKNAVLLVKALALIPPSIRIPLVLVGRETPYIKEIKACAKEKNVLSSVHFINDASFQDFPEIYKGARMFLFPSVYEGFGIPLLEAIESGIPVITSKRSVFNETAGPDAFYIDPDEPAEAAIASVILMYDHDLRKSMIEKSQRYINKFQAEVIANELQAVYTS